MMRKNIRLIILLPLLWTAQNSFAYTNDADWNYLGSGRDTVYSQKVDDYYKLGYSPESQPATGMLHVGFSSAKPQIPPAVYVLSPNKPGQFTITFPDSHGRLVAVVLKQTPDGFVGPKGELYPEFPKPWQLQLKYGN